MKFSLNPAAKIAAQDQLQFDLPLLVGARGGVRVHEVASAVMAHDFAQRLVGADILELDINHGINAMLAQQRAKAILPAVAGKDRTVMPGYLPVEIELRRPPRLHPVFQLRGGTEKAITRRWFASGTEHLDLQVPWLFHFVRVGHEIGALLGAAGDGGCDRDEQQPQVTRHDSSALS